MFLLRALLASATVFTLVYVVASCAIAVGSNASSRRWRSYPADILFAIRLAPVWLASLIVSGFTIPAYLLFEVPTAKESLGLPIYTAMPIFVILASTMLVRGASAGWNAARLFRLWTATGIRYGSASGADIVLTVADAPPVILTGILRPVILVSTTAQSILGADELKLVVAHELAHAQARDNLKKFLLCLCAFPGMTPLEKAWRDRIEIEADQRAVTSPGDALTLAATLVKVARLPQLSSIYAMSASFADVDASNLQQRLTMLMSDGSELRQPSPKSVLWISGMVLGAGLAVGYPAMLPIAHLVTEWFFR